MPSNLLQQAKQAFGKGGLNLPNKDSGRTETSLFYEIFKETGFDFEKFQNIPISTLMVMIDEIVRENNRQKAMEKKHK